MRACPSGRTWPSAPDPATADIPVSSPAFRPPRGATNRAAAILLVVPAIRVRGSGLAGAFRSPSEGRDGRGPPARTGRKSAMNASPSRDVYTQGHRYDHRRHRGRRRPVGHALAPPRRHPYPPHECPHRQALPGRQRPRPLGRHREGPGLHHGPLGHLPPMTGKGRAGPQGREILPRRLLQGARGRRDQPGNRRD